MKKVIALLLTLAMLLCLCACTVNPIISAGQSKSTKDLSPNEAIARASELLKQTNSMQLDCKVGFTISGGGMSIEMDETVMIRLVRDPEALYMETTMFGGGFGSVKAEAYIVKEGNSYIAYARQDGGTWMKSSADAPQEQGNVDTYLDYAVDYQTVGEETLNGEQTVHYKAVIPAAKIAAVIENSTLADTFGSLGLDASDPSELAQFGDLPLDVWISEASGRMVRFTLDMTPVIQGLMTTLSQQAGMEMNITDVVYEYDLSEFDEIPPIVVPDEVIAQAK